MLKDILCWIGLATCEPVQPDVSAHTILNMLVQTEGRAELLLPALGSLYEEVEVHAKTSEAGKDTIKVDLGRDGRRFAMLSCKRLYDKTLEAEREKHQTAFSLWADARRSPLGPGYSARATCHFSYEDGKEENLAFLAGAEHWGTTTIGQHPEQQEKFDFLAKRTDVTSLEFSTPFAAPRTVALSIRLFFTRSANLTLMFDAP